MTISQNFIFVSLLVLLASFHFSAASDVEIQSEKVSSNSSSVNSKVLESNVSLVREQNTEETTTSGPWEDDETTTYDEEETTTEKVEIETTVEEIEIETTTEEKEDAETTLAQDTTSEEDVENTTENDKDLSTPQKEEDSKDPGDEISPESGSLPTAAIIVVSILISFAGIFTGLYFLRGYLFRRRRDDQLKLLRSSEGFFHGSSFSFHDSI